MGCICFLRKDHKHRYRRRLDRERGLEVEQLAIIHWRLRLWLNLLINLSDCMSIRIFLASAISLIWMDVIKFPHVYHFFNTPNVGMQLFACWLVLLSGIHNGNTGQWRDVKPMITATSAALSSKGEKCVRFYFCSVWLRQVIYWYICMSLIWWIISVSVFCWPTTNFLTSGPSRASTLTTNVDKFLV